MKELFELFTAKQRLLSFTERLSELVSSGISLQKSLYLLSKINFRDKKLNRLASFLHKSLLDGTKFSVALKMAPYVTVGDWYAAFITVAEETGGIRTILEHLKNLLLHRKITSRKICEALLYPCIVIFLTSLAGFLSVFYFLPSFSSLFGEEAAEIQGNAVRMMLFGDVLLVFVFFLVFLLARKILSFSPCVGVLRTMAFLSEHSISTMSAVSCAFAVAGGEKRLSSALLRVRNCLLDGEKIAKCFGRCFVEAGFKSEGIILSENLSISEETGKGDGFSKTCAWLCERQERSEKIFLSLLQPFLLMVSALYLCLILKVSILPYITNFGGVL